MSFQTEQTDITSIEPLAVFRRHVKPAALRDETRPFSKTKQQRSRSVALTRGGAAATKKKITNLSKTRRHQCPLAQ